MAIANQRVVNTSFVVITVEVDCLITLLSCNALANLEIREVWTFRFGVVVAAFFWLLCGVESRIVSSAAINILFLAPPFIQSVSGFPECCVLAESDVRWVGDVTVVGCVGPSKIKLLIGSLA